MKSIKNILVAIFALSSTMTMAHVGPESGSPTPPSPILTDPQSMEVNYREDCQPATSQIDLNVNNVRARLLTGGDLWWDLMNGSYIVPNPPVGSGIPEVSSLFAGGVWVGGEDPSGNLKIAATMYRTGGNTDFYPGPIDPLTGLTELERCNNWDEFFVVNSDDLNTAIQLYDQAILETVPLNCDSIPDAVRYWPGKDNPYFQEKFPFPLPAGQNLGSFWDQDLSGDYDPCKGDFPIIDIRGCEPISRKQAVELIPDQMIFWIYNDAGGEHRLTRGAKIQMEIQVQAFAYSTNDEINDMTFYRHKLLNRAQEDIRECYFAMWVDPDLGCSSDDYIGCDVERGLAYTYNEDVLDGETGCDCSGINTYCDEVPIIGTDYFRGPLGPHKIVDPSIGTQHIITKADEFEGTGFEEGDTIYVQRIDINQTDEADINIELGMSSFIYFNRLGEGVVDPNTVDPSSAQQYYGYLTGQWLDGTPITEGGSGYNPGSVDEVNYVFPDDPNVANGWSMCTADLGNGDRRTVQASGPLLLKPSVENELIIGAVWVPDLQYPCPDISRLKSADDLAQALFDSCFDIIDGPTAPDVCPIALDREIILVLSNDTVASNNAFEQYSERDILANDTIPDDEASYKFEGYLIYQLANINVTPQELDDFEKARLIEQVDVKNGVGEIYNWTSIADPNPLNPGGVIYSPVRSVDGGDNGIKHTFRIVDDAFADADSRLINHKQYHYMVLAYGYNQYAPFDPDNPRAGQIEPYLEGRKNIKTYTVVPRPIVYTQQNANYGDGAKITRIDGVGVGGNFIDMDPSMYEAILSGSLDDGRVVYKDGAGPIEVNIYDPINVQDGKFTLELVGDQTGGVDCRLGAGATWVLTDLNSGEVISSERDIDVINEQLLPEYGFSLSIAQSDEPGTGTSESNGGIDIVFEYDDPTGAAWYGGIPDDGQGIEDFPPVLAPVLNFMKTQPGERDNLLDPNAAYSTLGNRTFYPFFLTDGADSETGQFYITPAWQPSQGLVRNFSDLSSLNNVDIVFTSDKSKWSRCAVVETAGSGYAAVGETTQGLASNMDLRQAPSIDQNGQPDDTGTTGMSWFPGYAVDVETGDRLNIFFGENSVFDDDFAEVLDDGEGIGGDMMFNPSSQFFATVEDGQGQFFDPRAFPAGGQHVIYVTREKYDGCEKFVDKVTNGGTFGQIQAFTSVTWCSISLLPVGMSMLSYEGGAVPNDLIIKLRADNSYSQEKEFDIDNPDACTTVGGNPKYEFEISGRQAEEVNMETIENALSNVNVVPNPYYGYSDYELSQFTKTVKITNLPDRAIVTIYSLDGKFIRQFDRAEVPMNKSGSNPGTTISQTSPDLLWDLNNSTGIPVASGVYLIHIAAPDFGVDRTIKWFGVNRKFDPSGL